MGTTNYGNQDIQWNYYDPLNSDEFDKHSQDIIPTGIYKGGSMEVINTTTIRVNPLVCMISDGVQAARIKTSDPADLSIVDTTPYVILRWSWAALTNWYMDMLVVDFSSILPNDIVVGKGVFNGSHELISIDYTPKTVTPNMYTFLQVTELNTPAMNVFVNSGWVSYGASRIFVPAQVSPGFTAAPGSPNSRIDLVYIDSGGNVLIMDGSPAVSPVPQSHTGKIVLAEVLVATGTTAIRNSMITDSRPWINLGGGGGLTGIIPTFLLMGA